MKATLALLMLAACAPSTQFSQHVVTFGDSLTHIYAEYPGNGYVEQLQNKHSLSVLDKAVGGTVIAQQLEQIKSTNLVGFDYCIFMPGANDAALTGEGNLGQFAYKLDEALYKLNEAGLVVYLGTVIRWTNKGYAQNLASDEINNKYSEIIRQRASPSVIIVDVNKLFVPSDEKFRDTIHPNATGNAEIMRLYEEAIYASH
jgi:lysophospholipase L1-like esterase